MTRGLGAPGRILCVAPNWLGDAVFSLPAVDALRKLQPGAEMDAVARPALAGLLESSGRFALVHRLPAEGGRWARLRFHRGLARMGYGLAVVFPDSFSSALGARLSGARTVLGRAGQGRSPLLTLRLPPRPPRGALHVVDEFLALAEAAGAAASGEERIPTLRPSSRGVEEAAGLMRAHGLVGGLLVGLCPTAAYGPSKRWPAGQWRALGRALAGLRYRVALFCAPAERAEWEGVAAAEGWPLLSPSVAGLAACFAECAAVVGNDSGSLHLAAAVGARCLGLYGSTNPRWTGPLGPRAEALTLGLGCSPCYARTCPLGHHGCLATLGVERVLDAFHALLRR